MHTEFRLATDAERKLLRRLLDAEFQGRQQLANALDDLEVRTVDEVGSLELRVNPSAVVPVASRIPVEAEAEDEDGITIHVLLHVVGGRPVELEVYKDDGSPIQSMPNASDFRVVVWPPPPGCRL
jgi:hypothetical protein